MQSQLSPNADSGYSVKLPWPDLGLGALHCLRNVAVVRSFVPQREVPFVAYRPIPEVPVEFVSEGEVMKDVGPDDRIESQDVEDLQNDDSLTAADRMDLIANQALADDDADTATAEQDG
jgi:hypothetical protein